MHLIEMDLSTHVERHSNFLLMQYGARDHPVAFLNYS